jgi:hypothetical protein
MSTMSMHSINSVDHLKTNFEVVEFSDDKKKKIELYK